jgi:hypothetical protein
MADSYQEGSTTEVKSQDGSVKDDKIEALSDTDPTISKASEKETSELFKPENKQLMDSGYDEPFLKKSDPALSEETAEVTESDQKISPSGLSPDSVIDDKKGDDSANQEDQESSNVLTKEKTDESSSLELPAGHSSDSPKLPSEIDITGEVKTISTESEISEETVQGEMSQQSNEEIPEAEATPEESTKPQDAQPKATDSHKQVTDIPPEQELPNDTISTQPKEQEESGLPQIGTEPESLEVPSEVVQSDEPEQVPMTEQASHDPKPTAQQDEVVQDASPEVSVSQSVGQEILEQVEDISSTQEVSSEKELTEQKELTKEANYPPEGEVLQGTISMSPSDSSVEEPAVVPDKQEISQESTETTGQEEMISAAPQGQEQTDSGVSLPFSVVSGEDPVSSEVSVKHEEPIPETSEELLVSEPAEKETEEITPKHDIPQETLRAQQDEQTELQSAPAGELLPEALPQSSGTGESESSTEIRDKQPMTVSPPEQEKLPQEEMSVSELEYPHSETVKNGTMQDKKLELKEGTHKESDIQTESPPSVQEPVLVESPLQISTEMPSSEVENQQQSSPPFSSHGPLGVQEQQQSNSPPRTLSQDPHIEGPYQSKSPPQTPSSVPDSPDMWESSPNQVPSPTQIPSSGISIQQDNPGTESDAIYNRQEVDEEVIEESKIPRPEYQDVGHSSRKQDNNSPIYGPSPEIEEDAGYERQEVVEEVIVESDISQGLKSAHVSVNMEPNDNSYQQPFRKEQSTEGFPGQVDNRQTEEVYEEFFEEVYEEEEKTVGTGPVEAKKVIQLAQDTSILLDQFEENGKLSKVSAYFANKNVVRFQVWRPNGKELEFYLVFEAEVDSTDMGLGAKDVPVILEATVQKGDRLALCSRGGSIPVGYAETKEEREFLCRKASGDFEKKKYKYNFSVSAAYVAPKA